MRICGGAKKHGGDSILFGDDISRAIIEPLPRQPTCFYQHSDFAFDRGSRPEVDPKIPPAIHEATFPVVLMAGDGFESTEYPLTPIAFGTATSSTSDRHQSKDINWEYVVIDPRAEEIRTAAHPLATGLLCDQRPRVNTTSTPMFQPVAKIPSVASPRGTPTAYGAGTKRQSTYAIPRDSAFMGTNTTSP